MVSGGQPKQTLTTRNTCNKHTVGRFIIRNSRRVTFKQTLSHLSQVIALNMLIHSPSRELNTSHLDDMLESFLLGLPDAGLYVM